MADDQHATPVVVPFGRRGHDVVVRPGVIVWLAADDPAPDEVARAIAMHQHPSSGAGNLQATG